MYAFTLNMVIATIWLLLSSRPGVPAFLIGFVTGYALIAAFRHLLPGGPDYVRRSWALLRFVLSFGWQFLKANFSVAAAVLLRSRDSLNPNFLTYNVADLRPGEILLLTYCITLTPGTVTIRVSDTQDCLIVHALDADHPDEIRRQIDRDLKAPILRFTR